jgi:uncharacterized protein HemX
LKGSKYILITKHKKTKHKKQKTKSRQFKANQGKSRQIKANQGKSRQIKANQGKSRQIKAIQGNSRQIKANQGKSRQIKRGDILPVIMFIFKISHQFLCRSQDIRTNVSHYFSFIKSKRFGKSKRYLYISQYMLNATSRIHRG